LQLAKSNHHEPVGLHITSNVDDAYKKLISDYRWHTCGYVNANMMMIDDNDDVVELRAVNYTTVSIK